MLHSVIRSDWFLQSSGLRYRPRFILFRMGIEVEPTPPQPPPPTPAQLFDAAGQIEVAACSGESAGGHRTQEVELRGGPPLCSSPELVTLVDHSPLLKSASSVTALTWAHLLSWLKGSTHGKMCRTLHAQRLITSQTQPLVAPNRTLIQKEILGRMQWSG